MALTRKFLTALGIEAEKIDEIITAHTETVNALKTDIGKYREDAEKLPSVQKELDDLKAVSGAETGYKEKYDQLKQEYDEYKGQVAAERVEEQKRTAYRAILKEAGIPDKRVDKILKLYDMESVELDKDGKVVGSEDIKKSIAEEWADIIPKDDNEGARTSKPPVSTGGNEGRVLSRAAQVAQKHYEALYGKKGDSNK